MKIFLGEIHQPFETKKLEKKKEKQLHTTFKRGQSKNWNTHKHFFRWSSKIRCNTLKHWTT